MNRLSTIFTDLAVWAFLAAVCIGTSLYADDEKQRTFFEEKIRPVLIKHCYECHSAKSEEVKGSLRVDSAKGLLDGGDSGPSIVPGKPDASPLIEALRYDGVEMPPAGRLPANIVEDFATWVKSGAFDPRTDVPEAANSPAPRQIDLEKGRQFWAFQPVKTPPIPEVSDTAWPAADIDTFVLAKLESAGLTPAADADRQTLIRRLYFDLIGLPPTPEEVAAFVADHSPDALERVVDRLLASEQFGVQWGRHWLDVARYADSNGSDFNATFHNAWKYRDYVIDSYNRDQPFDSFVRAQLAGDLLPYENDAQRTEQIVATGFLMIGTKMLSERDKVKLTMDVVDEQLNVTGQAFMGLTLGCARCHDHKFDPIPTSDYYALAGIFRSTRTLQGESQQYVSTWPRRNLPAADEHIAAVTAYEKEAQKLQADIKQAKAQEKAAEKTLARLTANEKRLLVDDVDAKKTGSWKESTYKPSFVGKGYIHDERSEKGEKWVEFTIAIPNSATYDVQLSYTSGSDRAADVPVSIKHAAAEVEVTLNEQKQPPIDGLFASIGQFPFSADQPATITVATRGTVGYVIVDAVRLVELDDKGQPIKAEAAPENEEIKTATAEVAQATERLKQLEQQLKQLEANAPEPLPKAIAVDEAETIGDTNICVRGEHTNLGPIAPRGVLQVALNGPPPKFDETTSGRLELANWIASPQHPLTARVYVNRLWYHLIGQGIVASLDNFGKLGQRPTHPELLDYLAAHFMADSWSTKQTIRRIVLSRTYRMSSQHDENAWTIDPENKLLWRAHRRRLPAESIRDAMLAISGQLELAPGGSPVEGLGVLVTQNTSEQPKFERKTSQYRSAYLPIIRSEIPAILGVFDFADPDLVTGRRAVTNVPSQALLLLNSPFVMDQAENAASRIQTSAGVSFSDDENELRTLVTKVYKTVLSRPPTAIEFAQAVEFLSAASGTQVQVAEGGTDRPTPLAQLIHTLFASTEFRMLD